MIGVVTVETQQWAAEQVVRMHGEPANDTRRTGVCARCVPGGGCPMLAWALSVTGAVPEVSRA